MRLRLMILAASAATVLLVACGGGDSSGGDSMAPGSNAETQPPAVAGNQVAIKGFAYSPVDLTVSQGTAVRFTNEDSAEHTATAEGSGFDTGTIERGQTKTVKLERPGTFTYVCSFHPFMHGSITVK